MTITENAVAKATEGLDDNLKPEDDIKTKTPEVEKQPDNPAPDETAKDGKGTEDDTKGFTADEIEDEIELPKAADIKEVNTDGLTAEGKYIVDNLPYMVARIKEGDAVKEVQVKSWTQLPDDVTFATKRDELAFMNALTAQENRALDLQRKFQNDAQQTQNHEFEVRENNAIREDIAKLQKDGLLPKFKVKAEDPTIEKDPAYLESQKVLEYMNGRNEQYLKEYNQGRPFRHIGFEEAFYMYQRQHPGENATQKQEDQERKNIADKIGGNKGLTSSKLQKPTVKSGTTINQILDRIDAEW
jgi:hypothetical protein